MKNRLVMIIEIVFFAAYIFANIAMAETRSNEKTKERKANHIKRVKDWHGYKRSTKNM